MGAPAARSATSIRICSKTACRSSST
jgi:hypothetical protein